MGKVLEFQPLRRQHGIEAIMAVLADKGNKAQESSARQRENHPASMSFSEILAEIWLNAGELEKPPENSTL